MPDDVAYDSFIRAVKRLIGVDLTSYRQEQLRRRLESLMVRLGAKDFGEYGRLLERDPARLQEFRDYFTINVTEFFRDTDRFRHLQTKVLPELLRASPNLSVWSAACSNGAEPYSVAMQLKELAPRGRHRILATDVDRTILAHARAGAGYGKLELQRTDKTMISRYFTTTDGTNYTVNPDVRKMVEFREHNLLSPAPGQGFDLILCRNVVIYFTNDAKAELYGRLVGALRPGGVLFVGGTEIISAAQQLGITASGPSFYTRGKSAAAPERRLAGAGARG
ncbi:MAG: CheR family methyltransferase [Chloroflexota bacterium]